MKNKLFVISLGGSLIIPGKVDTKFLRNFKNLVQNQIKKGCRFIIITGGGKICREYQEALIKISKIGPTELDWMGINSTWLNAKLVQLMFEKLAYPEIAKNPERLVKFRQPILVGGGWKPGRSSDGSMIKFAHTYKAKTVINLSNVSYVYNKDPKKYKNAKKLTNLSWNELLKITGHKWIPGKNVPFDPTAARFAKKHKIKAIIANGKDLKNLDKMLSGKKFRGTAIS